MKRQYELVVFDWEGTLAEDALGHAVNILAEQGERFHFAAFDKVLARRYLPLGLTGAIRKIYPDLLMYQYESFVEHVQEALARSSATVCLVAGVETVLCQIRDAGIKLAIASNKGNGSLQRVLQLSSLDKYFPVTRSASQVPAKPCPQMLEEIMEDSDVSAAHTLMVGDSVTDIEMAVSIGVDAVGMDLYQEHRSELLAAGALQVVDNYSQLMDFLGVSKGVVS